MIKKIQLNQIYKYYNWYIKVIKINKKEIIGNIYLSFKYDVPHGVCHSEIKKFKRDAIEIPKLKRILLSI